MYIMGKFLSMKEKNFLGMVKVEWKKLIILNVFMKANDRMTFHMVSI